MSNPLEPDVKTNPQGDPISVLEPEQKSNPQGDPITSAAPIKVGGGSKDPQEAAKKQRVVSPDYMYFEAPRKREFITGSEAAKEAVRRSNVRPAGAAVPATFGDSRFHENRLADSHFVQGAAESFRQYDECVRQRVQCTKRSQKVLPYGSLTVAIPAMKVDENRRAEHLGDENEQGFPQERL